MEYLFYLPPNTEDNRDHMLVQDPDLALLEGRHYMAVQERDRLNEEIELMESQLRDRQPAAARNRFPDPVAESAPGPGEPGGPPLGWEPEDQE